MRPLASYRRVGGEAVAAVCQNAGEVAYRAARRGRIGRLKTNERHQGRWRSAREEQSCGPHETAHTDYLLCPAAVNVARKVKAHVSERGRMSWAAVAMSAWC
jgi:hypothetical protein